MSEEKTQSGDVKLSSPFLKKLENFWYHYKWYSIIAAFLVLAILICSLQMCAKDDYDFEIMYAGPYNLNNKQTILDMEASFAALGEDRTGDGKVTVNLVSYWVNEKLAEGGEDTEDINPTDMSFMLNQSLNNQKLYMDEIRAGNLVICLVSPYLFHLVDDEAGFMRVTDIFPEIAAYEEDVFVYDEDGKINRFGVVLSKTAFGQMAGIASLPDDTILCVRKSSPVNAFFGADKAQANHEYAVEIFRQAVALGKKES